MARRIALVLMLLLAAGSVLAIGVSPARKVLDYVPGQDVELSLKIKSDGEQSLRALIYARGELEERIAIRDTLVTLERGETEAEARYVLSMPESMSRPGVHKAELVVMEFPSSYGTGDETLVSATASVVSQLWLQVPFPGKYAEGELLVESTDEAVRFAIPLSNFGRLDIDEARATIRILGATYEEIATLETDSQPIPAQERATLFSFWTPDVSPGRYHAEAVVTYDDESFTLEKDFTVGALRIDITSVDVGPFRLGDIAAFDINLKSHWNEPIPGVFGEMTISDSGGTLYGTIKTASEDIAAQGTTTLQAYWDTEGITVGTYDLRILVHYASRVTERLIQSQVNIDSIRTELGPTAQVIAEETSTRDTLLTALVMILVLVNIFWLVYFSRKRRKR